MAYFFSYSPWVRFSYDMCGWGQNRDDGKEGEENRVKNEIFFYLVQERKQERQKMGCKIIHPGPHYFVLPIWEEN